MSPAEQREWWDSATTEEQSTMRRLLREWADGEQETSQPRYERAPETAAAERAKLAGQAEVYAGCMDWMGALCLVSVAAAVVMAVVGGVPLWWHWTMGVGGLLSAIFWAAMGTGLRCLAELVRR